MWVNVSGEGRLALPHPVLCVLTVRWPSCDQHSLRVGSLTERRSHAWSSVRRSALGWRKPASFSWSRTSPPPLFVAQHMLMQSPVLVKNECWMESKNSIRSSWLARQKKSSSSSFPFLPWKVASLLINFFFFPCCVPVFDLFKISNPLLLV